MSSRSRYAKKSFERSTKKIIVNDGQNSVITSFRLHSDLKKKLENTSKQNDTTVNKLITGILEDHFAWDEFGSKLGLMIMLRSFYIELMDLIDRDKIKELAQTVGKEDLKTLITFVHGRITIDSVVKETEMYFKKIHAAYRFTNRDNKLTFIVENNLGNNWPYYVVSILNSILLEIGYKIAYSKYEKKSFSFEIIKKR
jgi:predicted DNA-binding ribbon-helix-helix protein